MVKLVVYSNNNEKALDKISKTYATIHDFTDIFPFMLNIIQHI